MSLLEVRLVAVTSIHNPPDLNARSAALLPETEDLSLGLSFVHSRM
jgi:hypothetical protein